MRSKKVSYVIANPCHEDWEAMTAEVQGKFCAVCSKSVVDFSKMSDASIMQFMERNKNEKICGRFTADQLSSSFDLPQKRLINIDLRAVILGVALSTVVMDTSYAQGNLVNTEKVNKDTLRIERTLGDVAVYYHHDEAFAKGVITMNSVGQVQDVIIELLDEQNKVIAKIKPNKDGSYQVDLDWKLNPVGLRFSGLFVNQYYLQFSNYSSLNQLDLVLTQRKELIKGKVERVE